MANDHEQQLAKLLSEASRRKNENKLASFAPYPKQALFCDLTATKHEVAMIAANKIGKTYVATMMTAAHLTGRYWKSYRGRRFDKETMGWACGQTHEALRDTVQELLLGPNPKEPGNGAIPKDAILDVVMSRGIPNAVDYVLVRHSSGGTSRLAFKPYSKGREPLQGPGIDFVHVDEEPDDIDVYLEIVARTTARRGIIFCTFTPLLGRSHIVQRFMSEGSDDRAYVNATLWDAEHFTEEERERVLNLYPKWQQDARARGVPLLGTGLVFDLPEDSYLCAPMEIPPHYARICGLDFGIGHAQAAAWIAHDRDTNTAYVYDCFKVQDASAIVHAAAIKQRDPKGLIPVSWPADGLQRDKGSGEALRDIYKRQGVKMLSEPATDRAGTNSVEASILAMRDAMITGQLKIFSTLSPLIEELRLYHRKDGLIVKLNDDAISAVRYGHMMLRYAKQGEQPYDWSQDGRRRRGEWNDRSIAGVVVGIDPLTGAAVG